MSWVPPKIYAKRFFDFMNDAVFPIYVESHEDEEDDDEEDDDENSEESSSK